MQKGFAPILIVLLVVLGIGGYFIYKNYSNTQTTPYPSADPTANWQIYNSSRAPYSFKYPKEQWPLVDITDTGHGFVEALAFSPAFNRNTSETSLGAVFVFKDNKVNSIDDYIDQHIKTDSSKINLQYTTIGGEQAVSYKLSGGIPPLPIIQYAVYKDGYYYEMWIDDSKEVNKDRSGNLNIFNQIISTFKFLEFDESSSWRTFSNNTYSFKYPDQWYVENLPNSGGLSFFQIGVIPKHSTSGVFGNETLITIDYSTANFDNMKNGTKNPDNSPVYTETTIAGKRVLKSIRLYSADILVKHLDNGNDRILNLRVTDSKNIPILDQILSTFKFTN